MTKTQLNTGDAFPELTLTLIGGSPLQFPSGLDGRYRVALFYRGHW